MVGVSLRESTLNICELLIKTFSKVSGTLKIFLWKSNLESSADLIIEVLIKGETLIIYLGTLFTLSSFSLFWNCLEGLIRHKTRLYQTSIEPFGFRKFSVELQISCNT